MLRRTHAISAFEATQGSPTLAKLTEISRDSEQRLACIQSLVPFALRALLKAGPIEDHVWCLIVENNAAASKLRQLLPSLEAQLRIKGWPQTSIRLKVSSQSH